MIPKGKTSKSLVQRAAITSDPQKAISEYFQSQAERQNVKKYPEWDVAISGPQGKLLQARRDLSQVDGELEEKIAQYDEKRKYMKQQWTELRCKENLLRESLIKFDKFVKESREKRRRGQENIDEEIRQQEKYRHEITVLEESLRYLTEIRDKMCKYVKEYKKAQNYLEDVVKETREFKSITDILNRYDSLLEAREALAEHQDKSLQALEEIGINMRRMTEAKGYKLMSLNNQLVTFQSRYDHAKAEALKWENVILRIKTVAAEKTLQFTQIESSCWNMYQQVCKQKGVPLEIPKDDIENQLVHIKRTIVALKRIVIMAKTQAMEMNKNNKRQ